MANPDNIVVVGGGLAGLAAAFELTKPGLCPGKNVVVYQMGWRLGGKCASGRDDEGRIIEHGLHIWFGYYENAFCLLQEVHVLALLVRNAEVLHIAVPASRPRPVAVDAWTVGHLLQLHHQLGLTHEQFLLCETEAEPAEERVCHRVRFLLPQLLDELPFLFVGFRASALVRSQNKRRRRRDHLPTRSSRGWQDARSHWQVLVDAVVDEELDRHLEQHLRGPTVDHELVILLVCVQRWLG